eukprot:GAFH01001949.1.p9 GENE.GAFH01001949.1~~GAFH01001949.1.p9  ORF type:complete len:68 (+),score=23.86 GAFH01001949.1:272-475(+)
MEAPGAEAGIGQADGLVTELQVGHLGEDVIARRGGAQHIAHLAEGGGRAQVAQDLGGPSGQLDLERA